MTMLADEAIRQGPPASRVDRVEVDDLEQKVGLTTSAAVGAALLVGAAGVVIALYTAWRSPIDGAAASLDIHVRGS